MCCRFRYFTSTFTLGGAEWFDTEFDAGGCSHIYLLQGCVPLKIWGEDTYVQAGFCQFAAHCEAWRGNLTWGEGPTCVRRFFSVWGQKGKQCNFDLTINSSDDFKILAVSKRNPYMKHFSLHITEPSLKYSKFKRWLEVGRVTPWLSKRGFWMVVMSAKSQ